MAVFSGKDNDDEDEKDDSSTRSGAIENRKRSILRLILLVYTM